jgi:HK97 family phage major capsid protein
VVLFDDMASAAPGAYVAAFGNFNIGYQIVDRVGIRVLRDPYTNKPYIRMYTTKRVGGDVTNFEAIKLLKCTS